MDTIASLQRIPGDRRLDRFCLSLAHRLPRRLVMWCYIRVAAAATSVGDYGRDHPDSVSIMEALARWTGQPRHPGGTLSAEPAPEPLPDAIRDGLLAGYSMLTLLYHRGHIEYTVGTFASPTREHVYDAIVRVERGLKAAKAAEGE